MLAACSSPRRGQQQAMRIGIPHGVLGCFAQRNRHHVSSAIVRTMRRDTGGTCLELGGPIESDVGITPHFSPYMC